MKIEILKKFCSFEEHREPLHNPFTIDEWTYATDGSICIKVPKITDVHENKNSPNPEFLFKEIDFDKLIYINLPNKIPDETFKRCDYCQGYGKFECECEDCTGNHECNFCDNGTIYSVKYFDIGNKRFKIKMLKNLKLLPDIKICVDNEKNIPLIFNGGQGILMPINKNPDTDKLTWSGKNENNTNN